MIDYLVYFGAADFKSSLHWFDSFLFFVFFHRSNMFWYGLNFR